MRQARKLKKTFLRNGMKVAAFIAVLVLVFSPLNQVFEVPFAQAASCPEGTTQGQQHLIDWNGVGYYDCVNSNNTVLGRYYPYQGAGGTYKSDGDTVINGIASFLAFPIYLFTAGLGGAAATLGSYVFNVSIYFSLNSTAYALGFITQGWEVARDLANMFFILILIYLAVTIVLEADTSKTMQTLVRVLAIALVINFSFFVTRVVIDAGNFTAVQFYNNIKAQQADGTTVTQHISPGGNTAKDLSASIMNAVGVSSIIGSDAFSKFQAADKGFAGGFGEFVVLVVVYVCLGVAYFILAAIFAATAIKFFIRIAVLWLTIVASPLAFLAYTVPAFQEQFKKWRDILIQHAFFPVTFLFIYWLISLFAPDLDLSQAFTAYNNSIQGTNTGGLWAMIELIGNVFVRLAFLVIMIYLGLSAADKVGVMGAQWANGVGGLVGRNFLGRAGFNLTRSQGMRDWAARSALGSTVLRGAGLLSRSSFDLRNVPVVGKAREGLGLKEDGTGKGGYGQWRSDRDKEQAKAIHDLGESLKGDIKDQERAQARYEATYKGTHEGKEENYGEAVARLKGEKASKETEIKNLRKKAAETGSAQDRSNYNNQAKVEEARLKLLNDRIKGMVEHGKKEIEKHDHHNAEALSKRLIKRWRIASNSRGTLKGIAGLTHHESKEDKLVKAAKDLAKGDDDHGEGGDSHNTPTKPATPPPAKTSTPPAEDHSAPAKDDHHDGGGHGDHH
jgi:hypothetical protein